MSLTLTAPQPLTTAHRLDEFSRGEQVLEDWLRRRAIANQARGARRTSVVADQDGRVYGYYAMTAGAVSHQMATGGAQRNMPEPIPVMVLARGGRSSRAHRAQGIELGGALLQDAVNRALVVSQNTGVRALLVHSLHGRAKSFNEHYGFEISPADPMTFMLRLSSAKA